MINCKKVYIHRHIIYWTTTGCHSLSTHLSYYPSVARFKCLMFYRRLQQPTI